MDINKIEINLIKYNYSKESKVYDSGQVVECISELKSIDVTFKYKQAIGEFTGNIILSTNKELSEEEIRENIKTYLEEDNNVNRSINNVCVSVPEGSLKYEYKVITKDKYIEHMLNTVEPYKKDENYIDILNQSWKGLSKGYDFVIAAGKDYSMFYSVPFFNENVLKGNSKRIKPRRFIF